MKMDRSTMCVLQTLLLLLLMVLPPVACAPCPRPCSCPRPTELHCTFRSLLTFPAAVSRHVERINLGFNSINKLTEKSLAGMRRLELLMIHGNNIHTLPDGVFRDLISLQMLKMSYNKLTELTRHSLQGLWGLTRLHLDHNQLEFIHPDAFHGLTSLRLLQLEGNSLQQLHPDTFTTFTLIGHLHVSTLRHLYLSDNGLMSLRSRLLETMPQLENLYLHGNPWSCDCSMMWLHDWDKTSPGVLKCKKDKALPSGQVCPICSSPRSLQQKELQAVENLVCSGPVITSPHRTSPPEDTESEVMTMEDFREVGSNISLGLSDEHGNEVALDCSLGEPRELTKVSWEQLTQLQLLSNVTLAVDLECPVDREKYEQLWRLIAYYSNVPAHLKRDSILSEEPRPTYIYKQDWEKDALYYTGVKVNIMSQAAWLMQTSVDLQLNRLQSSGNTVKLILSTFLSETVEAERERRLRRTWVMIQSTNMTRTVFSALLGSPVQMDCSVHSSGLPVIHWMLPDGSKLEAPSTSSDNRVSVSADGRLAIQSVSHTDTGVYYCIAKVHGDLAVLPFHLTVQDSSSPPPGQDASLPPIEGSSGNPLSLPCTASSSPDAEINWILPSRNIVSLHDNSSRALVYSNGTLHIPRTQPADSGYYKCIAINQHGVDTLATKVSIVKRKETVKPLKRFPARPQSAAGVNTKISVPAEDTEEASGDMEGTQGGASRSRMDSLRRRVPGGVAMGRRGAHPSRGMWQRQPVLRKQTGSRGEDKKDIVENRRRINMSKSKIDPEKWADILAKIREKNVQNTVTANPAQLTTEREHTEPGGTTDGSPRTPQLHTHNNEDTHVTLKSLITHNRHNLTSDSRYTHDMHATTKPHTTQSFYNLQQITTEDVEPHTSSHSEAPPTTSVPLHTLTSWHVGASTASSSDTFSLQHNDNINTDVYGVKTAERSKASESSENTDGLDIVASSDTETELSSSGSPIIHSVHPNKSEPNQEENGKYHDEAAVTSQPHTRPKHITLNDFQSQAMLTTASLTTAVVPTTSTRGLQGPSTTVHQQQHSRRRNGGRRKRPNRRKQKQNKFSHSLTTTPVNPPLETIETTPSQLKIHTVDVTTEYFQATVPFSSSQAASSGRLSHKESNVSGQDEEKPTSSPPASPHKTKDSLSLLPLEKRLYTSVAPAFPRASPEVPHEEVHYETVVGISEGVLPSENSEMQTSLSQQSYEDSTLPSVKPMEEAQKPRIGGGLGPAPCSGNSCETQQSYVEGSYHLDPLKEKAEEISKSVTLLPSATTSAASWFAHETEATSSMYTPDSSTVTPSMVYEGVTMTTAAGPDNSDHSFSLTETTREPEAEQLLTETSNTGISACLTTTAPPSVASSRFDPMTEPHVPLPKLDHSPQATTQQGPQLRGTPQNIGRPVQPLTMSPLRGAPDIHPETQSHDQEQALFTSTTSSALNPSHGHTTQQMTTAETTIRPHPSREKLPTTTQDQSRKLQLPARGSFPRGKPRIILSDSQTFTVREERDAQLPCEAVGEPVPFLSWTKVASGASIAQNTRVQRFEVHVNGTLTIRNTQPTDGGQYQCIVQNQYGTDRMVVDLVVLSPHPQQRDVTVHLGGSIDLECDVGGDPIRRVTWVLPNQAHMAPAQLSVGSQQRVTVLRNGTLRISQTTYTDRGLYKCIASSATGPDTMSVHLYVSALAPVIQQSPEENRTLTEGSRAYIHCTATGAPPPVVQWVTPEGVRLTPSMFVTGRNLFVFPNGTLYIHQLGPGNSGRYECTASNAVASTKKVVVLNIVRNLLSAKAMITSSSPQRTDVIYGGILVLHCMAAGQPDPWIIWKTPSKKLVDAQYSFDPRIKVFANGTITVHAVTNKDDGDYLCVARNKMGDDYVQLHVNVLTRPAKIEQKQQRSNQEVVYGGDLKVDCVASGLPNPEISWALPDGTMVNPVKQRQSVSGGRSRRYVVFDNGTLYFNDVGMREEGDYTCYAENQLGKDEMKVRVKIKASTAPPRIQDKDRNAAKVFYGETASLKCHAKGEPMPVVTWISPTNRVISPSVDKYQVLNDGTLVIQKVQRFDGGNYTCTARNSAGQDLNIIRLEVMVTPPTINGLRGTENVIRMLAVQDQWKLMDCIAKGTPTPRTMWVLPGNVILPSPYHSKRMTVHQNGSLEIRPLKKTDSGQLACIARNEGGEVRLVVNLDVKEAVEKPQIRGPKTDSLSLTVGTDMTLNCFFEGPMLPHITWILPSGIPLLSGARSSKFFHQPNGSLIISNPSIAEAGMYRCLNYHSGGVVEQIITLSPGRKPEIINRYSSPVSIMNGETFFLHCLTSDEPLRLTWTLPSGVVLNRPQRAGRYSVLANGTLAIQQVSFYDRGSYVCRAANEYGSSLLSVNVVVIAYPPRITNGPPPVMYAKRGVAVQLNCIATGIPRAEVAWETPDKTRLAASAQPRLFGNKYLHPQGSLVIQNPTQKDAGVYRCTARNAIGIDSKATFLNVF